MIIDRSSTNAFSFLPFLEPPRADHRDQHILREDRLEHLPHPAAPSSPSCLPHQEADSITFDQGEATVILYHQP